MPREPDPIPGEIKELLTAAVDLLKSMTRWFDRKDTKG